MAKTDISTTTLLAWDKYKDKTVSEALQSIYERASSTSIRVCAWYWTNIKTKRLTAFSFRCITFLLVIFGTVLPILAGLIADTERRLWFAQLGVAALALGGLMQVADRVFGWSSGWLRYITTVTSMENLTRKFELDWAGYILIKRTEALNESDTRELFNLAKQFEDDIVKLQSEETDKWSIEFNSGTALLGDLIKSQRELGEKAIEEARQAVQASEKAKQSGALELKLVHKAEIKAVKIAIDKEKPVEFTGTSWSSLNVPPGQHIINVETTEVPPKNNIMKVVEIPAGGVARDEVELA
ncbi:MAG: hypothetical protein BWK80_32645 [Desulfobacteraceae bacterium IS3]|nr:MAG: hypothetical protein BWK80_32645 [Desulfobacteraceae bacterium IS3]